MSGEDEAREPAERSGPDGRGDRADRDARADQPGRARRRAAPDSPTRGRKTRRRKTLRALRITAAILGPVLLTFTYFAIPFDSFGHTRRVLPWVILGCLLVLLAAGMLVTTVRALADDRSGHPGLYILLLSWTSILVFATTYWFLAIGHGQFSGIKTRLDALYFTAVTMATVGYGDIYPSGQTARAMVLVQIVYTFAFLAGGITALGTRLRRILTHRLSR